MERWKIIEQQKGSTETTERASVLAIIDCFKKDKPLQEYCPYYVRTIIIPVIVPASCTDKLQPIDLSINKPIKDQDFQSWYADEDQRQMKQMPLDHDCWSSEN